MYNLTDTYWLGKIGTEQLAAINLVTPMQNIITNFGSGITVAGAVLIAQYIGAGEKRMPDPWQIRYLPVPWDLPWSVPHCVFWEHPLSSTGWELTEELHIMQEFICGWSSGICPFIYGQHFSAIHQAQGDTVRPMFLNLGGITLNLFLDPFS